MYKPKFNQMTTPILLQKRSTTDTDGVDDISYNDFEVSPIAFCQFKGKGGTETVVNGTPVVVDTAEVLMWYREDIEEKDRILLVDSPKLIYEIVNMENIEMKNQFLMMKVKRVVNA